MNGLIGKILAGFALLMVANAHADDRGATLRDVAVIQNDQGAIRVLFRTDGLEGLGNVAISRATLTIPTVGVVQDRAVELRVYPVTRAWDPGSVDWYAGWDRPGGDFDEEVVSVARLDLRSAMPEAVFDVTGPMKEILESEMEADGFILTVAPTEGDGLLIDDLPRFGGLAAASLDIAYRKTPPRPTQRH